MSNASFQHLSAIHGDFTFEVAIPLSEDPRRHLPSESGGKLDVSIIDALATLPWSEPGLAIDVGSRSGTYAMLLAGWLGMETIAIEGDAHRYSCLCQTIALNGFQDRIRPERSFIALHPKQALNEADGTGDQLSATSDQSLPLSIGRLGGLDESSKRVRILRIGSSRRLSEVLSTAEALLTRWRPVLWVDCRQSQDMARVLGFLSQWEYELLLAGRAGESLLLAADGGPLRLPVERLSNAFDRLGHSSSSDLAEKTNKRLGDLWNVQQAVQTRHSILDVMRFEVPAELIASVVRMKGDIERSPEELAQSDFERRRAEAEAEEWRLAHARVTESRSIRATQRVRRILNRPFPATQTLTPDVVRDRATVHAATQSGTSLSTEQAFRYRRARRATWAVRDGVRICVASVPERASLLRQTIESLDGQGDEICVWLNRYSSVPDFLIREGIRIAGGTDLGDRGKYAFLGDFQGFYITVDDDIVFPSYFVESIVHGLERYERSVAVGWHGSQILDGFQDYYDKNSRRVLLFRSERTHDEAVDVLGTGCAGFHTDMIVPTLSDFPTPNMADIHFASLLRSKQIPMVVLAHQAGHAKPLSSSASIYSDSKAKVGTHMDVGRETTRAIIDSLPFDRSVPAGLTTSPGLKVAIVNLRDPGGNEEELVESRASAMVSMLSACGAQSTVVNLDGGEVRQELESRPDVCILLPQVEGDRMSDAVKGVVHAMIEWDCPTLFHAMPLPGDVPKLPDWVVRASSSDGLVRPFVYSTETARILPDLDPVILPLAIELPRFSSRKFSNTNGIFLGHVELLAGRVLETFSADEWISAIRHSMPGASIFSLEAGAKAERLRDEWEIDILEGSDPVMATERCRVMVSPFRSLAADDTAVCLAASGLPVVYRPERPAFNSPLTHVGIPVNGPADLRSILAVLYEDAGTWEALSRSGATAAQAHDHLRLAAALHLRLKAFVGAAGRRS